MTQSANITAEGFTPGTNIVKRTSVLLYGLLAYAVGCGGLFWLIFAFGGLAPIGISSVVMDSTISAVLFNAALVALFGVQHSVMARKSFKKWITRYIPQATERATYMLMSGLVTIVAIVFWQPLPGTVWAVENTGGQILLWGLYAMGWTYLLVATFVTNHFELMGLRQVYLYFVNKPYTSLPFTSKYMYSYSRHPMMLGVLVGMWALPVMSVTHLVLALGMTAYVAIGLYFEEKDLAKNFGDTYQKYKKEIATFIPQLL